MDELADPPPTPIKSNRVRFWTHCVYLSTIVVLISALSFMALERGAHRLTAKLDLETGVNSSADLTQQYSNYYQLNGQWPSLSDLRHNRGLHYLTTNPQSTNAILRTDIYRLNADYEVHFRLGTTGEVTVLIQAVKP
ncbi:MAG: hypothetical protein AAGH99_14155 [Planctomycetota bacterium]